MPQEEYPKGVSDFPQARRYDAMHAARQKLIAAKFAEPPPAGYKRWTVALLLEALGHAMTRAVLINEMYRMRISYPMLARARIAEQWERGEIKPRKTYYNSKRNRMRRGEIPWS